MPKPPPPHSSHATTKSQTTRTKESLASISQILHLTHHRNKNQHRLSKWYKQFSILRRNVSKLLVEVEASETAEKFSSGGGPPPGGRGKEGKYVRDAKEVVERRVEFLEDWVLERCFVAFSVVVKDLQYSSLGLMLLGLLAQIKSVIRPLGKEIVPEADAEEDEVEVIAEDGQPVEMSHEDANMQDLGEVVSRDDLKISTVDVDVGEVEEEETMAIPEPGEVMTPKLDPVVAVESASKAQSKKRSKEEKKKKKRKRGDAFDDLFDSLI